MPVILKINPQKRVVHSTFFGLVTEEELIGHGTTIASHPEFKPDYSEIIDLTMVTDLQVSRDSLQKLAAQKSIFHDSAKHAVVAPKDLTFQQAQEFQSMASTKRANLRVVRTAAEAYEFLALK